jgi:hypothetical protein
LILSFLPLNQEAFAGSNWDLRTVGSLQEANNIVAAYKDGGSKLNNLVILSHGSSQHLTLGKDKIDKRDFDWKTSGFISLNSLLGQVDTGGNILFIGCKAGLGLGLVMQEFARCDINTYMNMNSSGGGRRDGGYFFYMDSGISYFTEYGVRNLTTGMIYTDITVGKNGTITPIK